LLHKIKRYNPLHLRFHVAPTQNTQLLPKAVTRKTQRSFPALSPLCLLIASPENARFAPDFPGFRGSNEAEPGKQRGSNEENPGRKCGSSHLFPAAVPPFSEARHKWKGKAWGEEYLW
ncbi:MAG TPA: hypothetical protein VHK69_05220, partial [Chitinophagaceae bacterium]|nr:hypothetical protein [Chitinophagaceae bacterium]